MNSSVVRFTERAITEYLCYEPIEDNLGLKRYRKSVKRNEEEKKILLDMGLKKIEEKEKDDFIPLGYRRRRLKIL